MSEQPRTSSQDSPPPPEPTRITEVRDLRSTVSPSLEETAFIAAESVPGADQQEVQRCEVQTREEAYELLEKSGLQRFPEVEATFRSAGECGPNEILEAALRSLPTLRKWQTCYNLVYERVRAELQVVMGEHGNFLYQRHLAQGGCGSTDVWCDPLDPDVHLYVAKSLLPSASEARFNREIRLSKKLGHHLAVPQFHHEGKMGRQRYFVMKHIEGYSLEQLLKADPRPFPLDVVAELGVLAASTYQEIHRLGIIHRDTKPHNIMLSDQGKACVIDFGLAKDRTESSEIDDVQGDAFSTKTGDIFGTVIYMAPEQGMDAKHAGPPADVYSLGCTLLDLLTGAQRPYTGTPMQVLYQKARHVGPAGLKDLKPKKVADFLRKMMREKPEQRPTMEEVGAFFYHDVLKKHAEDVPTSLETYLSEDRGLLLTPPSTALGERPLPSRYKTPEAKRRDLHAHSRLEGSNPAKKGHGRKGP